MTRAVLVGLGVAAVLLVGVAAFGASERLGGIKHDVTQLVPCGGEADEQDGDDSGEGAGDSGDSDDSRVPRGGVQTGGGGAAERRRRGVELGRTPPAGI